jgi:hypothetical protein
MPLPRRWDSAHSIVLMFQARLKVLQEKASGASTRKLFGGLFLTMPPAKIGCAARKSLEIAHSGAKGFVGEPTSPTPSLVQPYLCKPLRTQCLRNRL